MKKFLAILLWVVGIALGALLIWKVVLPVIGTVLGGFAGLLPR